MNTATTGFNDVNHTVVGTNLKIKLPFKAILYNQFVFDGGSKYGYQFGIRYFGIKNLTVQAEYNNAARDTYSSDVNLQAYTNYNEPLAHSLGANFNEIIGIINYKYKRLFTQIKYTSATVKNIEIVPLFDSLGQFVELQDVEQPTNINILQFHLGVLINPKNNMSILFGINQRLEESSNNPNINKTDYFYFGFRTSLRNLYDDF